MVFIYPQKILFKHCDPAGIVFFPRYFEMINDCVEAFFDTELGHPFENLHKYGGVPTAEISANFLSPSRHGDRLIIRLNCIKIGNSSLRLEIVAVCENQTKFTADSTLVFVNQSGRPESWPKKLRQALERFMKEHS